MRYTSGREQGRLRPGAVGVLLLTCAVTILACTGSTETIGGSTGGTATTITALATATVALTPTAAPPKPTSTPKPKPKPTATPVPFRVTSAAVSVKPSTFTGDCTNVTITFTFTFKLLANGPGGTLTYQTSNPDGPPSTVFSLKVASHQTVATATQQVDYDQTSIFADESPWVVVASIKPNHVTSSKSNFKFYCLS